MSDGLLFYLYSTLLIIGVGALIISWQLRNATTRKRREPWNTIGIICTAVGAIGVAAGMLSGA